MTVTTEDRWTYKSCSLKNLRMYISETDAERYGYETYAEKAEKLNGRTAMLGFVAALYLMLPPVVYSSLEHSDSDD